MLLTLNRTMLHLLALYAPLGTLHAKIGQEMQRAPRRQRAHDVPVVVVADEPEATVIVGTAIARLDALGRSLVEASTEAAKEVLLLEYHTWRALVRQLPLPI